MRTFRWDQVRARRLARSYLITRAPREQLVDVVGNVCGIQAQVMSAAELAIGARVDGVSQQDVRAELWDRRALVKTYGPRGTLHLLPARELPMWMAALRAIPNHRGAMWYEIAGISSGQVDELAKATRDALDGQRLKRDELARAVSARVGPWAQERLASTWGDLLAPAALTGALCFGPSIGAKVTFVRADQWIDGWREEDPGSALRIILRRFLAAYGPTTPANFARWFVTNPVTAQELFAEMRDEVTEVDLEGKQAWMLAADLDELPDATCDLVRLVPQYDCFVIGSHPREQLLTDAAYARIRSYGRGRYEGAVGVPTLLVNGRVIGIWGWRHREKQMKVTVEAIDRLTPRQQKRLAEEVARIGAFFGTDAQLTIGMLG